MRISGWWQPMGRASTGTLEATSRARASIGAAVKPVLESLERRALLAGDTISTAMPVPLALDTTLSLADELGDEGRGGSDVDMFRVELAAGEVLVADIDGRSALGDPYLHDSILTVFDSAGNRRTFNDDRNSLDSYLTFTADAPGAYYVGVSSYSNFNYSPFTAGTTSGTSTGLYVLKLSRLTNRPPVAHNDDVTVVEDFTSFPSLLSNDVDPDENMVRVEVVSEATFGRVTVRSDGRATYTPPANFSGFDSFAYRAVDAAGAVSNVATVRVNVLPSNDRPAFTRGANQVVPEDSGPQSVQWATDISVGPPNEAGQSAAFVLSNFNPGLFSQQPSISPAGVLTYAPAVNANGTAAIQVWLRDDGGTLNGGQNTSIGHWLTIAVDPVNDAPAARAGEAHTDEDTPVEVDLRPLASDVETRAADMSYRVVDGPAHGTLGDTATAGVFLFTPAADFNGEVTFTYQASDTGDPAGDAGSVLTTEVRTVTVRVAPVNDAPVADADGTYALDEDHTLVVAAPGVLDGDNDVDGDSLAAVLVDGPANAVDFTLHPDGSFTYTPAPDFHGADGFSYNANDGAADSETVTVSLLVSPVNDAPVLAEIEQQTTVEGSAFSLTAVAADIDAGPDVLTYSLANAPAGAAIDPATGVLTWTPEDPGAYTFEVHVSDSGSPNLGDSVQVTVNVSNVAPTLDPIVAPLDPAAVNTLVSAGATFHDAGSFDTHTAVWDWGDGSTSAATVTEADGPGTGSVSGSHAYADAGVYTVGLTLTDDDGASATALYKYVVVYDPAAGFVTGAGSIDSPAGAYRADPSATGKATFGFLAKHQKDATVPTGSTKLELKVAAFNFRSTSYEWLVVSDGKAQCQGVGTVNGAAGYRFSVTVTDGASTGGADTFRIRIWDAGGTVYDNAAGAPEDDPGTMLGGGSIVVHNK